VAASCGASLHACLTAGLAVLSGPKHGGMLDRVEVLFDEVARPKRALEVVLAHLQRGDALPGFGHILYPQGDPRSLPLLELARVQKSEGAAVSRAVMAAMHELIGDTPLSHPAVDYAVVTTCRGYGLPSGTATALFALGRTAGWIAHVLEQRESLLQIRPRARFRES
jgi:citrate synthase